MTKYGKILGNKILKDQLQASVRNNRLQHAYVFCGEKGLGKRDLIQAFVMDLFCTDRSADGACCSCPQCKKIISYNHPDVIYIKHEKDSIGVDDIRQGLSDDVYVKPYEGRYKVYIINDADRMTTQAQNALLKTLEEPPQYAIIILSCIEESKLLETVISRSVLMRLKPAPCGEIRSYLTNEKNVSEEDAEIASAFARGNIGRALEILQDEDFATWYRRVIKICRNIKQMDIVSIRKELAYLLDECKNIYEAVDLFELWYRDLCMYKVTKNLNSLIFRGERKAIMDTSSVVALEGIQRVMNDIEKCRTRLNCNVNRELALELMFLSMKEN